MDDVKWTSNKRIRYISIAIIIFIFGAIISYFSKNHTRAIAQKKQVAIYKPIPLPVNPKTHPDELISTTPTVKTKQLTEAVRFRTGIISRNLQQAAINAGLTEKMIVQLDKMIAHTPAAHHIRRGDRLEVLYHEYFVNDHRNHPGHIVAAEIVGKHKTYKVVRFTAPDDKTGYYQANGGGTKPEFNRIPVHYVRIGSYFTYHRMDPILHEVRPHLGVDFDAPMGTPVHAIGNGIVTFCNQMRGYGNVVMIQYNRTYKTLYAHLEKFASHMHTHEYVKKGQIIGYVGETGWATGPHLHFAVFKNGVAVNPLTVHFPDGSPVPERYRRQFFNDEDRWFEEMKLFAAEDHIPQQKKIAHVKKIMHHRKVAHYKKIIHPKKKAHHVA